MSSQSHPRTEQLGWMGCDPGKHDASMGGSERGRRLRSPLRILTAIGPEIVAGASDNDPTNVGTAAVVGAQTAYQLSWVVVLVAPLLGIVQTIAAQVGTVTRNDLQSLTLKRYGPRVAIALLVSVVVVNVVTIAADLQAGAAGIGLLAGVGSRWIVLPLGLALVGLLFIGRYDEVVAVLRYLLIGFFAFGAAAVLARPNWPRLLRSSVVPAMSLHRDDLAGALALVGTTLTSYVYVWETIERGVEEPAGAGSSTRQLAQVRFGAVIGAVFTALIFWFMLVAAAATLGSHHHAVNSAQDAARSLRPLAGSLAADLFAAGLVVSAVVALPVLMATTAHVVGAEFNWRRGLSEGIRRAPRFYAVLGASIVLAVAVSMANVSVFGLLVAASVIGGFGTPIGLVLLVLLARDRQVMGEKLISSRLAAAGWVVAAVVGGFGLLFVLGGILGKL
jgi:Mn2+/Fe2+ NRAMP family transporter